MIRGALIGALLLLAGCSFFLPEAYVEELRTCVHTMPNTDASEACRCEVNKRYGRPCTPAIREVDGGL